MRKFKYSGKMRPELVRPSYPFLGIGIAFSNRFETLSPNTQKCWGCRQATILDFQLPNNKRGSARSDDTAVGVRNLCELVNELPLALHRRTERSVGTVSTAVLRCRTIRMSGLCGRITETESYPGFDATCSPKLYLLGLSYLGLLCCGFYPTRTPSVN